MRLCMLHMAESYGRTARVGSCCIGETVDHGQCLANREETAEQSLGHSVCEIRRHR